MRKIEVTVFRNGRGICDGFRISGHSGLGVKGSDILCSAVSVLAFNCINSVEAFTDDVPEIMAMNEEEGFLQYRLKTVSEKSELLLQSLVLGLQKIEEEYGRYITIAFTEE